MEMIRFELRRSKVTRFQKAYAQNAQQLMNGRPYRLKSWWKCCTTKHAIQRSCTCKTL